MGNSIFVDTSFFYALVDEKDEFHKEANKIWNKLQKQKAIIITSNYILDETFTLIRKRRGVKVLDEFRKNLAGESKIKNIRVTIKDDAGAWDYLLLDWSDLSFTDCVSFALMKRLEIKQVATFDQDFKKAGFKIV